MEKIQKIFNTAYKNGKTYKPLSKAFFDDYFPKLKGLALDYGCGTGESSVFLADRGLKVDGIDFSKEAFLQRPFDERVFFWYGDEYILSHLTEITKKKYNFILLKFVLAFIPKQKAFLKKLKSKLAPNGTLLVITPVKRRGQNKKDSFISVDKSVLKGMKLIHKEYFGNREIHYCIYTRP